ncbi:MAG: hypothetical protein JNL79_13810 [Myxococcales bacterium]|nr:hypothetical protein [Myxococcales bacterium]
MTGALVARVLLALERYYDAAAETLDGFLATDDAHGSREVLLVREEQGELELALHLPKRLADAEWRDLDLDDRCQLVEGVSHFLLVCERARADRSTTQLELELQAEVDKWLVLSNAARLPPDADGELRDALFEDVTFVSDDERYRTANAFAARFTHRLSRSHAGGRAPSEMRRTLGRFFRAGQEEKLRMARG